MNLKRYRKRILRKLRELGYNPKTIVAILHAGSSLYMKKNVDDIDLNVITTESNIDVEPLKGFKINGIKFDQCQHTLDEWNNAIYRDRKYFIDTCTEMKLVYGSLDKVHIWQVSDKHVQKYLVRIYDIMLFNPTEMTDPFPPKRLWSFLVFAFKYQNGSNYLTPKQLRTLQLAHDGKIDKERFRSLFNKMKGEIL